METRLYLIKKTLNQISVSGEENLSRLLGCIQEITELLKEAQGNEQSPAE